METKKVLVNFSEEIFNEILLRMQSHILIQCKCVCKSWNARISNPEFMAKHLVQTQNQNYRMLITRLDHVSEKYVMSLFSSENPTEFQDLPYDATFGEEGEDLRDGMTLLCCNDLLVFQPDSSNKIILWNPKETDFKILPQCHIPLDPPNSRSEIGFGFDSETNGYKVVRIVTYPNPHVLQTELYSSKTDSWRKLEAIPQIDFITSSIGIYINGMFYWYASSGVDRVLLSFDMTKELFDNTPLPQATYSNIFTFLKLLMLNDRPATIQTWFLNNPISDRQFDVWVLLEHGVKNSWTRLYRIQDLPHIRFPVGFGKNGELFMERKDGELWLYEPNSKKIKSLNIRGFICTFQITKYIDSE